MKINKRIALGLVLALGVTVSACGAKAADPATTTTKIKVGATPVPHSEILEAAKPLLLEKGFELEIVEFTDYVLPNKALSDKTIDANFFQHVPYLEEMNTKENLGLTYTVKVHIEPLGFYSETLTDFDSLEAGAKVAIPNDPTNGARALKLLADNGLITIADGDLVTVQDITSNPKNIQFEELDAAAIPRVLADVAGAVINTNYAIEADLNPMEDALVIESSESPYANILAVREDNKDDAGIVALGEVLTSEAIKTFIEDTYKGSIVPAF